MHTTYLFVKRLFDAGCALLGLVVSSPLWLIAAAGRVQAGLTGPSALYDYIYGDSVEGAAEYETLVLPTRLELDLVYLDKMGALFDLRMIAWTVACILAAVAGRRPEKIFNTLVQWAQEHRKGETET